MTRPGIGFNTRWTLLLFFAAGQLISRAADKVPPDFGEVYDLIRTNVPGVTESELNRAAVQGLVTELGSKVSLRTNGTATSPAAGEGPALSKVSVFEDNVAYLRVARVAADLPSEISRAFRQTAATNSLTGLVLDLRYAGGSDYAGAASTADLFVNTARPLLNWGNGVVSSQEKTNAIQLPVAVLVNGRTSGAAEALAASLRETGAGLILGGRTAGQAMVTKDFPLRNGDTLRVAVAPVTLGAGSAMSLDGVRPDIDVTVNPEEEHSYYADSFFITRKTNTVASAGSSTNLSASTNGVRRGRFNEAELVREHREGRDRDTGETPRARAPEPERPVVSDPALARALDLLRGLAVVRQSKS